MFRRTYWLKITDYLNSGVKCVKTETKSWAPNRQTSMPLRNRLRYWYRPIFPTTTKWSFTSKTAIFSPVLKLYVSLLFFTAVYKQYPTISNHPSNLSSRFVQLAFTFTDQTCSNHPWTKLYFHLLFLIDISSITANPDAHMKVIIYYRLKLKRHRWTILYMNWPAPDTMPSRQTTTYYQI